MKRRKKTVELSRIKPNAVFYMIYRAFAWVVGKLLCNLTVRRDPRAESVRGPLFIVGNHSSYMDPLFAMAAFKKRIIRFVAGAEVADTPVFRTLVKPVHLISINPFRINFSTTKSIIETIRNGVSVALYPERQRTAAGDATPFGLSTAKLIRLLGVPVAAVICDGAYLNWPRWGKFIRPGTVEVHTHLLFSAEEARELPVEEIQCRLSGALRRDDYHWQSKRRRAARFCSFRRAERLQSICHWCPSCGKPFVMRGKGHTLFCSECGQSFDVTPEGWLVAKPGSPAPFDHPLAYARWQRRKMSHALREGARLISHATIRFSASLGGEERPERPTRQGTFVLSREGLTFFEESQDGADVLSGEQTAENAFGPDHAEGKRRSAPMLFELGDAPALYCSYPKFADLRSGQMMWRAFPEKEGFVTALVEACRAEWMNKNRAELCLPESAE